MSATKKRKRSKKVAETEPEYEPFTFAEWDAYCASLAFLPPAKARTEVAWLEVGKTLWPHRVIRN